MLPALRTRTRLHLPITLSVVLMVLNVTLMVCWIIMFAQYTWWSALFLGVVVFSLILAGLTFYLFLIIKEVRLNQRQANFVDSVTHELKSPIASLRLYLETLTMRSVTEERRREFYETMEHELERLDYLISQLLEVGRLDAIGQQDEASDVLLSTLLMKCAHAVSAHHKNSSSSTFQFDLQPIVIHARSLVVETIFRNLFDNAIKYGGEIPQVTVQSRLSDRGRVVVRIGDNGEGVPLELRKDIFRMFFRGGNELTRRQKGTGLGLYIVQTLVRQLKGKVTVADPAGHTGGVFEVELPGGILCDS